MSILENSQDAITDYAREPDQEKTLELKGTPKFLQSRIQRAILALILAISPGCASSQMNQTLEKDDDDEEDTSTFSDENVACYNARVLLTQKPPPRPENFSQLTPTRQLEIIQTEEKVDEMRLRYQRAQDLFDIKYELIYHHGKDRRANIEDLMSSALGIKHRSWYMDDIWRKVDEQSDRLQKLFPRHGKQPKERHVHILRIEDGQILFINGYGNRGFCMDISDIYLQRDALEFKYGLVDDWILKRREQLQLRAEKRKRERSLKALFLTESEVNEPERIPTLTRLERYCDEHPLICGFTIAGAGTILTIVSLKAFLDSLGGGIPPSHAYELESNLRRDLLEQENISSQQREELERALEKYNRTQGKIKCHDDCERFYKACVKPGFVPFIDAPASVCGGRKDYCVNDCKAKHW